MGAALSPGSSALTDLYWAPLGILIDGSDLSWGCLGQDDTVALYSVITVVKVDDNKPCKYFLCDQGGGRRTQANWQLRHQTGHRFYSNLPGSVCVCVWERESCIEMCLIDCCIGPKLCVMCYIRYEARQSRCWWWLVVVVAGPNRFWAKGKLVQVSVPPVTSGPARWKRKVWKLHWRRNAAKFCCLHQIMLLNTALPSSSSADLNKHDNCNCHWASDRMRERDPSCPVWWWDRGWWRVGGHGAERAPCCQISWRY